MEDDKVLSVPMLDFKYVEFLRIDTPADADAIATAVLGEGRTHSDYISEFGISLLDYKGFYIEVGYAPSPRGPLTPMTISPILVLRRTSSSKGYKPQLLKVRGYMNNDMKEAWIDAITWEAEIGDDLAKKLKERMDELIKERNEARAAALREEGVDITVDELKNLIMDAGKRKR